MTTAAPVPGALFASLDDFLARWNEEAATVPAPDGSDLTIALSETALVIGTGPGGADVFASRVSPAAIAGGLIHPDSGTVQQLVIVLAPRGVGSSEVIVTAVDLAAPEAFVEFMTAYTDLLGAPVGNHEYLVSGDNDIVFEVFEFQASPGVPADVLISVAVAPVSDEATALANGAELREAVMRVSTLVDS